MKSDAADKEEVVTEIFWEIKAYKIFETLLDVKAIDKNGKMHEIRAIQNSEDVSILDVKAFIEGERLPVKLIIKNNERYYPLKAIDSEGNLIDIKAITAEGKILPVKGVSKTGNVVHLRAIAEDMTFYDIIAMSPDTEFNHVKGIKMTDNPVEAIVNGVSIFAHVKSIK
ncbi:DUF7486 family protein [Muriicola marianensis]|uniref:DUF7486 domain-containing protein n=1 Tax=Muriicola marianensis TaxID=1324801 RepID=A0ABQ1QPC3_9FLAO|nr:hypothetical protein [Muriicola marianensis]GGD39223.1 hypothetical protein GCM10011361_02920 [Muriicola marianensis]